MVNTSIWIWGMLISSFSPGCGQVSIGTELRSISLRMFGLFTYLLCCSVTQLCPTLCDPCSMPGFPVLHHLLELAQTHVH